jgi:hypothetical protein
VPSAQVWLAALRFRRRRGAALLLVHWLSPYEELAQVCPEQRRSIPSSQRSAELVAANSTGSG